MNERKPWRPGWGAIVLIVLALIVIAILATRKSRTLGLHQPLQLDDFFFTIEDAQPLPDGFGPPAKGDSDPPKANYLVRLKVENKAPRVPFKFDGNALWFVDLSGKSPFIRPSAERSSSGELMVPTVHVLKAGESATTDYLFSLSPDQSNLRLRVMPGGAVGEVLEWLFFGRKEFQLPSAGPSAAAVDAAK
jgi:hypothetical protein